MTVPHHTTSQGLLQKQMNKHAKMRPYINHGLQLAQPSGRVRRCGPGRDTVVPAEAPLCRRVYTGRTCFWLESSFHVCALQGEVLLKQHKEQLCQYS